MCEWLNSPTKVEIERMKLREMERANDLKQREIESAAEIERRLRIERIILFVADKAFDIASRGNAPPAVCRAIEDLSDDPIIRERLIAEIKDDLAAIRTTHIEKPKGHE